MIYLILSAGFKDNNPDQLEKRLKIGYTNSLEDRLKAYLTTNPDIILLQTREGDTYIESYLHKKFEKYRYKDSREWFYYNQEIIDHFQDELEDFIKEEILLDCIKRNLRSGIASVSELRKKYLKQILDEIKSLDEFNEELYDEEILSRIIVDTWLWGIENFNKAIDNTELVNYQPIDLLKINDPEVTVDITLDLPQILGRQRLLENPWKNRAELYARCLSDKNKRTSEEYKEYQEAKIVKTRNLLSAYDMIDSAEIRYDLAETYQYVAKSKNYKDDYIAVNTHSGKNLFPVFNKLAMVSELRAFQIQQVDYSDRFRVLNQVLLEGYTVDPLVEEINNFMIDFNSVRYFTDKMKLLCETKLPKKALDVIFRQIHVDFSTYYQVLGPEKIRALSYQKSKLDLECTKLVNNSQVGTDNIKNEFINTFKVDDKHTLSNIKKMVGELYKKLGLNKTPKAVDILDYFEVLKTRAKDDSGRFVAAYKILKIKEDLNG